MRLDLAEGGGGEGAVLAREHFLAEEEELEAAVLKGGELGNNWFTNLAIQEELDEDFV